jgi:hypothetical protein
LGDGVEGWFGDWEGSALLLETGELADGMEKGAMGGVHTPLETLEAEGDHVIPLADDMFVVGITGALEFVFPIVGFNAGEAAEEP